MSVPQTEGAATVNFDAAWVSACTRVSALAQAKLPEALHGRIQRATALAINGGVFLEDDGHTAMVRGSREGVWYCCNGKCQCEDANRAPDHFCKHRLAVGIYRRAGEVLREPLTLDLDPPPPAHGIRPEHIVHIQGKPFVRYAGLLERAHEEGLVELTATWTFNSDDLSLAEAVATFKDGRHFRESGDATKENCGKQVAHAWRRMSLTRAKSRVLRDALGIDLCTLEELAD